MRAFICGLSGLDLTEDESAFLREAQPWGVILFRRNVGSPDQIRRLTGSVREALGRDAPILIDQEGGRVQRIGPPHLRAYPPGRVYGALYRQSAVAGVEAARLGAKLIALDLHGLGITIDCIPVLDIPAAESSRVIGDRAYGADVETVVTLGGAAVDGLMGGGVLPVMKHLPGHGRAKVDSHEELPTIDAPLDELAARDFRPFRLWARKIPLAMTAHIVVTAVDERNPATLSRAVVDKVIRGRIGFEGVLMTDDISMGALAGPVGGRAAAALAAGCDLVLHCNGEMEEMRQIAEAAPEMADTLRARLDAVEAMRRDPEPVDRRSLEARFDELIGRLGSA